MSLADVTTFIGQVGFPIFIAVLLLWRFDANDRALIEALNKLTAAFDQLSHEINRRTP